MIKDEALRWVFRSNEDRATLATMALDMNDQKLIPYDEDVAEVVVALAAKGLVEFHGADRFGKLIPNSRNTTYKPVKVATVGSGPNRGALVATQADQTWAYVQLTQAGRAEAEKMK